jgi:hypothetical protein
LDHLEVRNRAAFESSEPAKQMTQEKKQAVAAALKQQSDS